MKKILVTTDLSDESTKAFATAKQIAKAFGASVTVLTVIENPAQLALVYAMEFVAFSDPDIQKQLLDKINTELKDMCAKFFSDVTHEYVIKEASAPIHAEILDYAAKNKVDLLVVSTHGRTGVKRLLIGNITERIVREARCPVLVVPVQRS